VLGDRLHGENGLQVPPQIQLAIQGHLLGERAYRKSLEEILYTARPHGGPKQLQGLQWEVLGHAVDAGPERFKAAGDSSECLGRLLAYGATEVGPVVTIANSRNFRKRRVPWKLSGGVQLAFAEVDLETYLRKGRDQDPHGRAQACPGTPEYTIVQVPSLSQRGELRFEVLNDAVQPQGEENWGQGVALLDTRLAHYNAVAHVEESGGAKTPGGPAQEPWTALLYSTKARITANAVVCIFEIELQQGLSLFKCGGPRAYGENCGLDTWPSAPHTDLERLQVRSFVLYRCCPCFGNQCTEKLSHNQRAYPTVFLY
jgi:hypothetical protein